MKFLYPFLLLLFISGASFAQTLYQIRADTVKIYSTCDSAELILENRTKDTAGFLFNKGKGLTEFRKIKLKAIGNDSIAVAGQDTIKLPPGYTLSNNKKLVIFGSSVAYGQGASQNQGWAYKLAQVLTPQGYTVVNKSIPGNNTQALINRFYKDVVPEQPDVVIIALSFANEGLQSATRPDDKSNVYLNYVNKLYTLVGMCRKAGIRAVVTGIYPANVYSEDDYTLLKNFDDEMENSDIPFINFLGAADDGHGHWRSGMFADALHPNDIGHEAMFRAIPPGFFDKVYNNFQLRAITIPPHQEGLTMGDDRNIAPAMAHDLQRVGSFTVTFWTRRKDFSGSQAFFCFDGGYLRVRCPDNYYQLAWEAPNGTIISNTNSADTLWHHFAITYSYYTDSISFYVDANLIGTKYLNGILGNISIAALGSWFAINPIYNPIHADFSTYTFHRVALLPQDIKKIYYGKIPKGSAEIISGLGDKEFLPGRHLINQAYSNGSLRVGIPGILPFNAR